jgi:hypothetical protein
MDPQHWIAEVTSLGTVVRIRAVFADPDQDPSVFLNADRDPDSGEQNQCGSMRIRVLNTALKGRSSKMLDLAAKKCGNQSCHNMLFFHPLPVLI